MGTSVAGAFAGRLGQFGAWGRHGFGRIGRAYRGSDLAAVLTRRRWAATAVLGIGLALGGCSSVANVVTDNVPTWAGGMPKDVPPRPGAPGYEEFISHQQRQDAAAAGTAPAGAPGQAAATRPRVRPARHRPRRPIPSRAVRPRSNCRRPTRGPTTQDPRTADCTEGTLRHAGAQQIVEMHDADRALFLDHEQRRDL